ncbi:MAG: hypothetical protein FJ098_14115, partial [Deltaproteobacteria bacterium]|nr:hypothetical protein [Deltaproteobacteria bacterium]
MIYAFMLIAYLIAAAAYAVAIIAALRGADRARRIMGWGGLVAVLVGFHLALLMMT